MDAVVLALMLWIGNNSDYNTGIIPHPAIVEMTPKEITKEAYTDNPNGIPEDGVDERIRALYSFEDGPNGTIYIISAHLTKQAKDYNDPKQNPLFQERLLHELVHHTQRLSGVYNTIPCRNYAEKEAYTLGGKFLRAQNVTDPMPNRNFWAHIYSRC
ncbi:MAG: hypothetical protein R3F02_00920 [Thiolinea sp.]